MKKIIFGYYFQFELNGHFAELEEELSFYPDYETEPDESRRIIISIVDKPGSDTISTNPSSINVFETGFAMNLGYALIRWNLSSLKDNIIKIELIPGKGHKGLRGFVKRFRSIGYEIFPEDIGKIIHELILVPVTFFFKDKIILHGASLYNKVHKRSIVLGGTGGVGKTSALLRLGKGKDWVFLSDDIVVVDSEGIIYPNYSYPKIYAYNTMNNKPLERLILKKNGLPGKFQWKSIKRYNRSRVRRRLSPDLLYNTDYLEPALDCNLFLFRCNHPKSTGVERIDSKISTQLEMQIILAEYDTFFRYLRWYEYNAMGLGLEAYAKMDEFVENYSALSEEVFSKANNYLFKLGTNSSFEEYTNSICNTAERLISDGSL